MCNSAGGAAIWLEWFTDEVPNERCGEPAKCRIVNEVK